MAILTNYGPENKKPFSLKIPSGLFWFSETLKNLNSFCHTYITILVDVFKKFLTKIYQDLVQVYRRCRFLGLNSTNLSWYELEITNENNKLNINFNCQLLRV